MAYTIPVAATTLTQYDVEVSLSSGEEVTYSVFQDPDDGDSPAQNASNWASEDETETVEGTSVMKVSFNQNLLPDEMVTELL